MTGNLPGTQNQPLSLAGNFLLAISKAPGYTYLYGMAYECFTGAPAFAGTSMPDLCAHDRIPMTCFKQTHVRMDDNATRRTQAGHAVEARGARSGSPRYRGNPAHTDYQSAVLQTLVSGRRNGVAQGMIAARMDELDPEAIPVMPQASMPGPAPVAERPVVAPAMTVTNAKEKELLGCCMNGNAGKARILLKYKYVNVNATCNHCTLLLSFRTVNINIRQYDGATPLFAAVQSNSTGIVKLLISNGADVNIPLTNGTTPLCRAAAQDNVEIVDHLLQAPGIRVNQTDDEGATALYFACQVGQVGSARLLLDKKADLNIVDIDVVAPLHLACLHGFTEIVEMLLEAGAGVEMLTKDDYSPYLIACIAGHRAIMELLETGLAQKREQAVRPEGWSPGLRPAEPAPLLSQEGGQVPDDRPGQSTASRISPVSLTQPPDMPEGVSEEAVRTPGVVRGGAPGGGTEPADISRSMRTPETPSGAAMAANQPRAAQAHSPLVQAKTELRQDILTRLRNDRLDPLDGITLMEAVNGVADLDNLCRVYNRLAGIERRKLRSAGKHVRRPVPEVGDAAALPRACPPGVLHVSAGISGVGSCSVFFSPGDEAKPVRIAGIGHHLDRRTYRLTYAAAGLQGLRTMRLS